MKTKRRAPARYHLTWRKRSTLKWCEFTYHRRPKGIAEPINDPTCLEDLKTGQMLFCNFDLRQAAFFATHDWPKRKAAQRAIKRFYAPKPPKNIVADRQVRIAKLRGDEKRWVKKFKLAHTKLRKIRAAIKRQERGTHAASPSHGKCGNCYDGKLLMSGETCGVCGNKEP